ncbi:MAG: fibronectin type III domain-containing protein [Candidatus Zixiibacteriota bacterium]
MGLIPAIGAVVAYAAQKNGPRTIPRPAGAAAAEFDSRLLVAGNLSLEVSNYATLGSDYTWTGPDSDLPDPNRPDTNRLSSGAEFPAGSRKVHLYNANLWIGGIRNGDTLVTRSIGAVTGTSIEVIPETALLASSRLPFTEVFDPSARSDVQVDCVISDTSIHIIPDDEDSNIQNPLGIMIRQTGMAWSSEPYDDFVIFEYVIRNASEAQIESTYVAMFLDADIWGTDADYGFTDDVAGFIPELGLAYAMDNDGDPDSGDWYDRSVRSAIAIAPVSLVPAPACTTFNWWIAAYSTGGEPFDPPRGDHGTYRRMATGPSMPDQMQAAVEYGFPIYPPRGSFYNDVADGLDTRVLLSVGPYDLMPGDSVTIALAVVMGDSVHVAPDDFATYWDPSNPDAFYNRLYFGDLIRNTETARALYHNGFDPIGAAPIALAASPVSDTAFSLTWQPVRFSGVTGYRVYRRDLTTSGSWQMVGSVDSQPTAFVDRDVIPAHDYEYSVAGIDEETGEGYKSRSIVVTAARPVVVPALAVQGESPVVDLTWTLSLPEPQFAPPSYLNIYRREDAADTPALLDQIPIIGASATSNRGNPQGSLAARSAPRGEPWIPIQTLMGEYTDESAESGVVYWYAASITNTLGLEGPRSEPVRAAPMALSDPGLVLRLESPYERTGGGANDPAVSFYRDWAIGSGLEYQVFKIDNTSMGVDSLRRALSRRVPIVLACDDPAGQYFKQWINVFFDDYLRSGGQCLFVGRRMPARFGSAWMMGHPDNLPGVRTLRFYSEGLVGRVFSVYSTMEEYLPVPFVQYFRREFRYAEPAITGWTKLILDSALAFSEYPTSVYAQNWEPYGDGHLPTMSAIDSISDGVTLYRFVSGLPDTSVFHGKISGFARNAPGAHFVLINVPLSLIERDAAVAALNAGMEWLQSTRPARDYAQGKSDLHLMIEFLYGGDVAVNQEWDQNGDGKIGLIDLVRSIDRARMNR